VSAKKTRIKMGHKTEGGTSLEIPKKERFKDIDSPLSRNFVKKEKRRELKGGTDDCILPSYAGTCKKKEDSMKLTLRVKGKANKKVCERTVEGIW